MSDSESNGEEVLEFICRKCPGKTFTAAEKDAHRMFHRNQREKEKKNKPGPKSRTRGSRRDPSPAASGVTLFEPVNNSATSPSPNRRTERPAPRTSSRRRAEPEPEPSTSKGKKKSKKNFDDTLIGDWKNGNGA